MTLTVIGTGFVGVVFSAVFASFGNTVYGLDIDQAKIDALKQGKVPFYEPGLSELVLEGVREQKLIYTTSYQEAISQSDVIVIAVGTPSAPDGQADLKFVFACAESLAPHLKQNAVVAIKSTVPPGTSAKLREVIEKFQTSKTPFFVASLPEFLREGSAVHDTVHADRVIIGAENPEAVEILTELHKPLNAPCLVMKPESAQMAKYAANAYLATRITFINQIADLCEKNGANIEEVIQGIGYDKRIGQHYWYPGWGYGGSCFPKDVKELAAYAKAQGLDGNLMVVIDQLNDRRIPEMITKIESQVGDLTNKKVAVLGLAFKPNTNDMRVAPSTVAVPLLLERGAQITAYDPMAADTSKAWFPDWKITYASTVQDALQDADIILFLTEWDELVSLDIADISHRVKKNALFVDSRNRYLSKEAEFENSGLQYMGVGTV
jgi:UDPglucose 6-dehydrogenase